MTMRTDDPPMPKGLTKAERSAVSRVFEMRKSNGDAVHPIEVDSVLDYVRARARLTALEATLRKGLRPSNGDYEYALNLDEKIKLNAAIERAAASCRRLGRDLRLSSKAAA